MLQQHWKSTLHVSLRNYCRRVFTLTQVVLWRIVVTFVRPVPLWCLTSRDAETLPDDTTSVEGRDIVWWNFRVLPPPRILVAAQSDHGSPFSVNLGRNILCRMSILEAVDKVEHGLTRVFVVCSGGHKFTFASQIRGPRSVKGPAKYPHVIAQRVSRVVEGGWCGHRW